MSTELVLVVRRALLFAAVPLQGFCTEPAVVARFLQAVAAHGYFTSRRLAEEDEDLKQIVPYGIVRCSEHVFLFRRGAGGTEAGLRGRYSIGLGGHVNPADGERIGAPMLEQALRRELDEEVVLDNPRLELWGVLNDDLDAVGRRHFGFVYRVWTTSRQAPSREPGKVHGEFAPPAVVQAYRKRMETWSRIILDARIR